MKKSLSIILTFMRIFILFILLGLTSVYGNTALSQTKIDINVKSISIEELFKEIQNTSDYVFFYKDNVLNTTKKVSLKFKNTNVSKVLDKAFTNTDLSYKVVGKQVVVKKTIKVSSVNPLIEDVLLQEKTVAGVVKDSYGQPLPGVNILIQGTTTGTQTGFDGDYSINVKEGDVLVFSFLGMVTQSITVGNESVVNVTLEEDAAALDEVVIVGYGSQSKESLTGSVSVVKGTELEQAPTSSFEQSLRGGTAGVQASALDGAPGSNTEIRIRGTGSINASSEPLYVIDGIPIQSGSQSTLDNDGASSNVMGSINPNDIESISILKDAASTAIYGSRGANGVILITTKQGKAGKAVVEFKTLTGFNSQASNTILKPLNAAQYKELFIEGYVNRGDTPAEAQARMDARYIQQTDPLTGEPTDTNWLDAITRTGVTQSYDLSVRGGTEKVKYFMSTSYMDQESYIKGYGFDRFSTRANLKYNVNDYITISNNISIAETRSSTAEDGGSWNNPFKVSLELSPLIPIYDENGDFNALHAETGYFPIGPNIVGSLSGDDKWETNTNRIIDNLAVTITPVKNLIFRSQWNFDILNVKDVQFYNRRYGAGFNPRGSAYQGNVSIKTWVGTQTLDYNVSLGEHNFNVLAGYEAQKTRRESSQLSGQDFPNDIVTTISAAAIIDGTATTSESTFSSMFSRANYNYAGKYFLSGSLRRDGSSRFGANNRYGTFYSVGASWSIHKENFVQDISFIDLLKLRSAFGVVGNAGLGAFEAQGFYTYTNDYDGNPGGTPAQIGNPDLGWETQENFNIGLDFGLFNRINGTVEYFKRVSSDLLLDVPISLTTGFPDVLRNYADMTNSGLEISLNADIINKNDFRWNLGFNATFLKNEITQLDEDFTDTGLNRYFRRQVGEDFNSFFMYGWAGIDPATGDPLLYTDATETATTSTISEAEEYLTGENATPDVYGGFNTSFSYKNFSLSANFMYSFGNSIFDSRARGTLGDGRLTPRSTATYLYDNRWVPGKTDALFPRFRWGGYPGISNNPDISRWLYDGGFVRLKDLTIAYNFPEKVASMLYVNSIRAYVRGTNILTFTKEKDLYIDPEQAVNGLYTGLTPAIKTISFGLDIQL